MEEVILVKQGDFTIGVFRPTWTTLIDEFLERNEGSISVEGTYPADKMDALAEIFKDRIDG